MEVITMTPPRLHQLVAPLSLALRRILKQGVAIDDRQGVTFGAAAPILVRQNGHGFGPPSAFYRQRYPAGRVSLRLVETNR